MAVTFTPNIGLAKPTETELAANWVNGTELNEDNNLIITDKMDVNYTPYTPTIIAATTPPSLGAGTIEGEYIDFQGIIIGNLIVEFFDPGVAVGLGDYGFSLPFPVDSSFHVVGTAIGQNPGSFSVVGEGYISDNSSVGASGSVSIDTVTIAGVSYARLVTETYAGKTVNLVRDNNPFAVATNDKFQANFIYKKA